jgi:trimeric autotransporter adhesin
VNYTITKTLPVFLFTMGLFITITTQAQVPTVNTVAGNGGEGYSGDNQIATESELYLPQEAVVDDSGNIYIADEYNNRVRKVSITTGLISTIAGGGTSFGDGGLAINSQMSLPTCVAADDSGNVYIVDDNRVRKITKSTGIINTIAGNSTYGYGGDGGPSTSSELKFPLDVALDDSANVYISDMGNNRIRKITKLTGFINTVAGDGFDTMPPYDIGGFKGDGGLATDAELNMPDDMAIDDSGNIFIADANNNVIRKVTAKTGIITTIAGKRNSVPGFSGDGGLADTAEFNDPTYLALDDSDNIYVSDRGNDRIRKITAKTGIITTIAGDNTTGGFSGDGGPANSAEYNGMDGVRLDRCSNIYIADRDNNRIRKITVTGPPPTTVIKLPTTSCPGKLLSFKDSSNFNATNWTWKFPGGTPDTSTNQNPSIVFNTSDIYYITVTAWNFCGTASILAALQVSSPPLIIQPPTPQMCQGLNVTLSVPVSGFGYLWSPASTLNSSTADTVIATPSVTTTYTVTGTDSLGCLATNTVTVTVNTPPNTPTITKTGDVLTSSATQSNQWLLNSAAITGATNKTYQVTTVGCYSVIAKNLVNGCTSTSDTTCVTTISGINQLSVNSDQLLIYPNPTSGEIIVNINSSVGEVKDWNLQITDVLGRTVYTRQSLNYSNDIDLSNLPNGVYFITVINKTGRAVVPVVRQ